MDDVRATASAPAATGGGRRVLRLAGVTKYYPGVRALDDADLDVHAGEVHALVGQNGAGKSTLMKVAAGAIRADAGTVRIDGVSPVPGDPRAAAGAGLAMIYQELTALPQRTAYENALLGHLPARAGLVNRAEARSRFRRLAASLGADIGPDARAADLSPAQLQLLEIMRALATERRVIVMDEPTASLGRRDRENLRAAIRALTSAGCGIVYISHDLEEVLTVADRVTVMRAGRTVDTRPAGSWSPATLVRAMLGDAPVVAPPRMPGGVTGGAPPALQITDLRTSAISVSELTVERGQIVGLAGLVGSGRTELMRALAGADRVLTGTMRRDGRRTAWPRSPRAALGAGIALVPEDRKVQGLVPNRSAAWNVALGDLPAVSRHGLLRPSRVGEAVRPHTDTVDLPPDRLTAPAASLSGGNQQKLLIARWLHRPVDVLLLDEPTRGIDIGAKAEVFACMRHLAERGRSIVWVSSELDEVVTHSDRVLVVAEGTIIADLGGAATERDILDMSFAARSGSGGPVTARSEP